MKFTNAYEGLKTLKLAEILNVISLAISGIISVVGIAVSGSAGNLQNVSSHDIAEAMGGSFITVVAAGIAMLLALSCFILQIDGISKARKDDVDFDSAFSFIISGIIVEVMEIFLGGFTPVKVVLTVASKVVSLFVMLHVISGIRNIARSFDNADMDTKGGTIRIVVIVLVVMATVCSLLNMAMPSMLLTVIMGALNLSKAVVFLGYLSKAVKMFGIEEEISPL